MTNNRTSLFGTIAFGFIITMSSGFGQTFFISLFNESLRQEFSLTHGEIGSLYFFGTLASATTIVWLGKLLDHTDLRLYTLSVTIGLACACGFMSLINGPVSLAIAFFLLRLFGQGLSGHTGITTASRVAQSYRGRTVSLAGLGFSAAEAVLPILTVMLMTVYSWREVWQLFAGFELIVITLATQLLLWHYVISNPLDTRSDSTSNQNGSWTRKQVATDRRFWQIAPAIFAPPIISTGLFFHQQSLAAFKNFTFATWVAGIAAYSLAAVLTSLIAGLAVDKWSGKNVVRFYLIPFICALLTVSFAQFALLPAVYYMLIGATVGIATPSISALWLELYGPDHIAAIRSLTHALMVFGTALGPAIFGLLLDHGVSWSAILIGCAVWMLFCTLLLAKTKLSWIPQQPS